MLESELVSTTARPLDEGRPETVTEPHPPGKMALCLSGGGLRATFFHLGVVRFLADAGYLNNENLRIISSVSGGSIMAAHLVKNWGLYTNPDTFDAAAADLIAFGQSDLRGRVVRRSLLRYLVRWLPIGESRGDWRSNTCLLMREYRRLFSTTREEILRRHAGGIARAASGHVVRDGRFDIISQAYDPKRHSEEERPPQLVMHSSCLNSGEIFSFSRSGVDIHRERRTASGELNPRQPETLKPCPDDSLRFSTAVAASSAFPMLFSPLEISQDQFPTAWADLQQSYDGASLTDGGVYDNLGVRGAQNYREVRDIDTFIISNAGASFDWQSRRDLTNVPILRLIRRLLRATDILTKRVRDMEREHLDNVLWQLGVEKSRSVGFSVEDVLPTDEGMGDGCDQTAMPMNWQKRLASVRTDMDAFDDVLVAALIQHGYTVARWAFLKNGLEVPEAAKRRPWCPARLQHRLDEMVEKSRRSAENRSGRYTDYVYRHLDRQSERKIGLFFRHDRLSHLYAAVLAVLLLAVTMFAALAIASFVEVWLLPDPPSLAGRWHYSVEWANGQERTVAEGYFDLQETRRGLTLTGMRTNANENSRAIRMPSTSSWHATWVHKDETTGGYQIAFDYRTAGFGGLVMAMARQDQQLTVMEGVNVRLYPGFQQGRIRMLKQLPDGRLAQPKAAAVQAPGVPIASRPAPIPAYAPPAPYQILPPQVSPAQVPSNQVTARFGSNAVSPSVSGRAK